MNRIILSLLALILFSGVFIETSYSYRSDNQHTQHEISILESKLNYLIEKRLSHIEALDIRINQVHNQIIEKCTIIDNCTNQSLELDPIITKDDIEKSYNMGFNAGQKTTADNTIDTLVLPEGYEITKDGYMFDDGSKVVLPEGHEITKDGIVDHNTNIRYKITFSNIYNLGWNIGFEKGAERMAQHIQEIETSQTNYDENPYIRDIQYQLDLLNKIYGTNHTLEDFFSSSSGKELNDMLNNLDIPDIDE